MGAYSEQTYFQIKIVYVFILQPYIFTIMQLSLKDSLENEKYAQPANLQNALKGIPQIKSSYRAGSPANSLAKICSSKDGADALRESWDSDKLEFVEQFKILLLNRANRVLGIYEVSTGGISGTVVDVKLVLSAALLTCASGIILAHNHPSGSLQPSAADKVATKKIREAASLLDIEVLDHLILTMDDFYSFADDGVL